MSADADDTHGQDPVRAVAASLRAEVGRVLVGQERAVEDLVSCVLAGGHVLIEGVPGLGKTLLARTVAGAMSLSFRRIQFTPDLLPSDITGNEVIQADPATGDRREKFMAGPLFANLILADEINRAPPKTQAALLEAMEERQVTVGGITHPLPDPFVVLATENPIEQEGTYPLPQAQCDRFLMKIEIDYPEEDEERRIAVLEPAKIAPAPTVRAADVRRAQEAVRDVPAAPYVIDRVCRIVRGTRPQDAFASVMARRAVACGASPRAGRDLLLAAQARAALAGRAFVTTRDVAAVAPAVLRHRVLLAWAARAEGIDVDAVIRSTVEEAAWDADPVRRHPELRALFR